MKVFTYLKRYRMAMAGALSLMLIELGVELWQPLLMARIIDEGIALRDQQAVLHLGALMLGVSLLAFAAGIINSFLAAYASQNFGFDIRKALFQKVQSFSFADFHLFPTSSLITRITNDVHQLQMTIFMSLRIALRAPLLVLGGVAMALTVNFRISLIFLLVIPPLLLFLIWVMKKSAHLFKHVQQGVDKVNGAMRENLSGMRLIRAYSRGGFEAGRFKESNQDLMERTVKALRLTEAAIPVLLFFMNISVIAVLWLGNIDMAAGSVTIGEIVAIVNYTARITAAFSMLSWIIMAFSRAAASSGRIAEVLAAEADFAEGSLKSLPGSKAGGTVKFNEVTFSYPESSSDVLHKVTFMASPGETVAFLGATGAGKSTIFQLIPRLYDPVSGSVEVNGKDIRTLEFASLRGLIGYVPQVSVLFSGTIRDNLLWGKETSTEAEMTKAAKDAQIHETIASLPDQYETRIGQKGINLSGGQKQRLAIARALLKEPSILLLDDSTSALDLKTERKLLKALKDYACTTLIITQKIGTAKMADKVILLEQGRIIAAGKHDDLMAHSPLYREICQSQQSLGETS